MPPLYTGFVIRKLADKSSGVRESRWNPETGEKYLYNPATPGFDHEAWPLLGVQIEDPPKHARLPTSSLSLWRSEGWAEVEGARLVVRSGGPPADPWRGTSAHVFEHCDFVILHTVDGDLRYEVVENPDKWPAEKLDDDRETGFGGEVRWHYDLKLVKD